MSHLEFNNSASLGENFGISLLYARSGRAHLRAGEIIRTDTRSTGPREALYGLIPDTLMDMRTDLTAVPHASLRTQILKNHVRGPERL